MWAPAYECSIFLLSWTTQLTFTIQGIIFSFFLDFSSFDLGYAWRFSLFLVIIRMKMEWKHPRTLCHWVFKTRPKIQGKKLAERAKKWIRISIKTPNELCSHFVYHSTHFGFPVPSRYLISFKLIEFQWISGRWNVFCQRPAFFSNIFFINWNEKYRNWQFLNYIPIELSQCVCSKSGIHCRAGIWIHCSSLANSKPNSTRCRRNVIWNLVQGNKQHDNNFEIQKYPRESRITSIVSSCMSFEHNRIGFIFSARNVEYFSLS